ncbi:MAG: peptidylprolyl isomerase [Chloroherpetonaceae bacterium]|nr:peptidylprolyl isomerase [Chthonomonadaceae bacterium]MDW8206701.1 peptidylprolyl isomerase [Chloroherpetonaceae bacterium]
MNKLFLAAFLSATLGVSGAIRAQTQAPKTSPMATRPKSGARPATSLASRVVGSVNGKPITWEQVIAQMRSDNPEAFGQVLGMAIGSRIGNTLFGAQPAAQMTLTREEVLKALQTNPPPQVANVVQVMLRNEALRQEAVKQGVNPTDADLDRYLNRMLDEAREQGQLPKDVTNDQVLAQRNLTRAKVLPQLRWQRQALNLIVKDMEKNLGRPYGPEDFLRVRHILVMVKNAPPDAREEDRQKLEAEALEKIKGIREEIVSGKKTFEQAASEYGEDGTKTRQGDLGVSVRGQMVPEFEQVAYSLQPGQISEPVKTQFGYHLIRVDKKGSDLTPDQRQSALDRMAQQRFSTFLSELMNVKYKVINNLPQPAMPPGAMGRAPGAPRPAPRPVNTPPRPAPPAPGNNPGP